MDGNIKYLALTLVIVLVVTVGYNLVSFKGSYSLGYCDFNTYCKGTELGGVCLGIKGHNLSCTDPENATEWMRAEVECTIQANPLCRRENIEGDQWATRAEYKNKTCSDWAKEYEEIDIIDCNQAFGLAEDYERLK